MIQSLHYIKYRVTDNQTIMLQKKLIMTVNNSIT